jgi:hypothetical protein
MHAAGTILPAGFAIALLFMPVISANGAVGCDLNDPDRDVKRIFPDSTSYRTTYMSLDKIGGTSVLNRVETRLGEKFKGIYETIDVPYTIYTIYKQDNKIGYIHGVNQKGQYGGIQVFLAMDLEGRIISFFIQKMTSQWAKHFRDPAFTGLFTGLTSADFADYDPATGKAAGKIASIVNPQPEAEIDFRSSLRAVKKNLILMDLFIYAQEKDKP